MAAPSNLASQILSVLELQLGPQGGKFLTQKLATEMGLLPHQLTTEHLRHFAGLAHRLTVGSIGQARADFLHRSLNDLAAGKPMNITEDDVEKSLDNEFSTEFNFDNFVVTARITKRMRPVLMSLITWRMRATCSSCMAMWAAAKRI